MKISSLFVAILLACSTTTSTAQQHYHPNHNYDAAPATHVVTNKPRPSPIDPAQPEKLRPSPSQIQRQFALPPHKHDVDRRRSPQPVKRNSYNGGPKRYSPYLKDSFGGYGDIKKRPKYTGPPRPPGAYNRPGGYRPGGFGRPNRPGSSYGSQGVSTSHQGHRGVRPNFRPGSSGPSRPTSGPGSSSIKHTSKPPSFTPGYLDSNRIAKPNTGPGNLGYNGLDYGFITNNLNNHVTRPLSSSPSSNINSYGSGSGLADFGSESLGAASSEIGNYGAGSHHSGSYGLPGGGKGDGEYAGRVKIKVFRGPTQKEGDKYFAPWGYYVSQPSDAGKKEGYGTHGYS